MTDPKGYGDGLDDLPRLRDGEGSEPAGSRARSFARVDNFGQDGFAHLTYYDAPTQLSFVWDLVHRPKIAVSHGGYGEGVIDTFEFSFVSVDDIESYMNAFRRACNTYVQGWNNKVKWGRE